jgi:hypothetical protein
LETGDSSAVSPEVPAGQSENTSIAVESVPPAETKAD